MPALSFVAAGCKPLPYFDDAIAPRSLCTRAIALSVPARAATSIVRLLASLVPTSSSTSTSTLPPLLAAAAEDAPLLRFLKRVRTPNTPRSPTVTLLLCPLRNNSDPNIILNEVAQWASTILIPAITTTATTNTTTDPPSFSAVIDPSNETFLLHGDTNPQAIFNRPQHTAFLDQLSQFKVTITLVPLRKPRTRPEFEAARLYWPMSFHETAARREITYSRPDVDVTILIVGNVSCGILLCASSLISATISATQFSEKDKEKTLCHLRDRLKILVQDAVSTVVTCQRLRARHSLISSRAQENDKQIAIALLLKCIKLEGMTDVPNLADLTLDSTQPQITRSESNRSIASAKIQVNAGDDTPTAIAPLDLISAALGKRASKRARRGRRKRMIKKREQIESIANKQQRQQHSELELEDDTVIQSGSSDESNDGDDDVVSKDAQDIATSNDTIEYEAGIRDLASMNDLTLINSRLSSLLHDILATSKDVNNVVTHRLDDECVCNRLHNGNVNLTTCQYDLPQCGRSPRFVSQLKNSSEENDTGFTNVDGYGFRNFAMVIEPKMLDNLFMTIIETTIELSDAFKEIISSQANIDDFITMTTERIWSVIYESILTGNVNGLDFINGNSGILAYADNCPKIDTKTGKTIFENPLNHPPMKVIDIVARRELKKREAMISNRNGDISKHQDPNENILSSASRDDRGRPVTDDIPISDLGYLCTGKDILLLREPCWMCGMALVHSRLGRVVIVQRDSELRGSIFGNAGGIDQELLKVTRNVPNKVDDADGVLYGEGGIMAIRSLNHHYRVYLCNDN